MYGKELAEAIEDGIIPQHYQAYSLIEGYQN